MRITLTEISKQTGISMAALSRVVNGHGYVSEEMRKKAEEALETYGYTRNLPKQIKENAFDNVVLLITGGLGNTYQKTIESFCEQANRHHRRILVAPTAYDPVIEKEYMRFAQRANLFGIIMTSIADREGTAGLLRELKMPVVLIARSLSGVQTDVVTQDNYGMGRMAGSILLKYGHRRIAYLGGHADSSITKRKQEGLTDILRENGLSLVARYTAYGRLDIQSGREYAKAILEMAEPPTAVFCSNDLMAIGIADTLKQMGLTIPDDLSLIACDRTTVSDLYEPHIDRLYIDWAEAAHVAFHMLQHRKNNPGAPFHQYTFETETVRGASLGKPRESMMLMTKS